MIVTVHQTYLCNNNIIIIGVVESVNQLYAIRSHSIACCGAGFSPNGQGLASGDLAGNVWVTEQQDYQPKYTATVECDYRVIPC